MADHLVEEYDTPGSGRESVRSQPVTRNRVLQLSSIWLAPLAVAAFWMVLVWSIHSTSPRTLVSFHGFLHAAIAGQFLDPARASFPPENPFYAGEPVAYYWFFQYVAAQLTRFFGLNIFRSMEAVILVGTGALSIAAVFLCRKLYYSTLSGALMVYLIMAGTNPLGWLHLLFKIARRGPHILRDNPDYLWGVVHPIYSLIRYNDVGGLYGPLFNFFLNITARPVALASLVIVIFCMEWLLRTRRPLAWAALALAGAATTAFSPLVGIGGAGALLAGLAVWWFWSRRRDGVANPETNLRRRTILYTALALVAGILIAAPSYYHLLTGPSDSHPVLWLFSMDGVRHVMTVALSVSLLVILALVGMFRAPKNRRPLLRVLILAAFVLLAFDLSFSLPASNQSNLFHAAVVLLSVPAAGSILGAQSSAGSFIRRRLAVGIVLVFLPTFLLLLTAYVNRPTIPASFDSRRISRLPANSDLGLFYQWAQNETKPNSIFIIDPEDRIAICGNIAEFPAMTNRVMFTEAAHHYMSGPYPDSKLRADMAARLVSGREAADADRVYMSKFGRPLYIVSYHSNDEALMSRMRELYGPPVFHTETIAVFGWPAK